jgi:serine/threonine-protein kinase HipA
MTEELRALKHVNRAVVYKKEHRAGSIVRLPDSVEFRYDDDYRREPDAEPLATTLPLADSVVRTVAGAVPPYFAGLLPEGRRLAALRTAVKTSADDELSLLLAVGADAVGDVRVFAEGTGPHEVAPRVSVADWDEVSFGEVFAAETGGNPDLIALPGVQPKASARMITMPVSQGSDRFILKLDPPEFPHLCRNEWLMLQAARLCGLSTVDAQLRRDRHGQEGLVVRRFDRTADGLALGVEDACQALNRYPADKYAVTVEQACEALARISDAPRVTARALLRWVAFAYVSCNGDLHAKNLAVAERTDGLVEAAPAYDLPASFPYGDTTFALTLHGKEREDIGRTDLLALADHLGVARRAAEKVLNAVVDGTDGWIHRLDESGFDARTIAKWRRAVAYRQRRLKG